MPALNRFNQHSQDVVCKNRLRTIYTTILVYTEDYDHRLPGPAWYGQKPNILTSHVKYYNYLPEFLRDYFPEPKISKEGILFNPTFICPSNEEIETDMNIISRVNYRSNYIKDFGIPFGRKANNQMPKRITELPTTHGYLLQDADFDNYPYFKNHLPQLPVHPNLTRNTLFADGKVRSMDMTFRTIDP
jgi:hypothetical protein